MITKSKIAAALAVVTLAGGLATTSAEAKGWHIGAGLAAGALVGAAVATSASANGVYYIDGGYRCRWERRYDRFGYYVGTVKVCRY